MNTRGKLRNGLLVATAVSALTLVGCGNKDATAAPADSAKVEKSEKSKAASVNGDMGGKSPIDKEFKVKDAQELDATAFMSLLNSDAAEGEGLTFASSEFDKKTGATVLTAVSASDDEGTMNIGRVELYGVNDSYIQSLKDGNISATKDDVFRKVRMFDVSFAGSGDEGEDISVTIGAMEIDGMKFGGFDKEAMDAMEDGAQFATAIQGFDLGGIYFKDMSMKVAQADVMDISFSAPDLRFGGFSGGNVGSILAKNFKFDMFQSPEMRAEMLADAGPEAAQFLNGPLGAFLMPEKQSGTIESVSWDGMSFAGMLPYMESGETPPLDAKNLLSFGKAEFRNAVSSVNGKQAATTALSVLEPIEFAWLVPTKIKSYSKDSTVDLTAYVPEDQPEMLAMFESNGISEIDADDTFLWEYDEKSGDAKLVYDLDAKGLANIDLTFNASNGVLETLYNAASTGDQEAFMNAALDGISLKIEDEKLLDLIFGVAGLQMGQDGAQLRAGVPMMIGMAGAQAAQVNPVFSDYLAAVSSWVSSGGTLEVKAAPEAPVALGAIAVQGQTAPQALPDILNITVTQTD